MTTGRLALVTLGLHSEAVDDPDRPVLDAALAAAGIVSEWVAWDDPGVDWSDYRAAWIRGTWDYTSRHREFLAWADHVDSVSELWNPAPVIGWNSHKSYLVDFAERGVPVVPTAVVPAGAPMAVDALLAGQGWLEAVVKPAVSVGAIGTHRLTLGAAGTDDAFAEARRYGDVLVQPFVPEVAVGETSVIVVEGEPTHAVCKVPAAGDFRVQYHHGGTEHLHEPTTAELALASQAVAAAGAPLLYARVDMVTPAGAGPQLMELELIEPFLFLAIAPAGVVDQLAGAVRARLERPV